MIHPHFDACMRSALITALMRAISSAPSRASTTPFGTARRAHRPSRTICASAKARSLSGGGDQKQQQEEVRVGDIVDALECVDFATSGEGVCRLPNGMVLLCDGATPGEIVEARITKVKKSIAEGSKLATRRRAKDSIEPPCPHYGECGGCAWQHVSYDAQVVYKRNRVVDVLRRIGKVSDAERVVGACVESVETQRYRNKMEFAFGAKENGDGVVVGLRPRGANDAVIDISEGCILQSEEADAVLKTTRDALERMGGRLDAFNRTTGEGTLRSMTIRTATNAEGVKSLMVDLATTADDADIAGGSLASLIDAIAKTPGVTNVVHTAVPKEAELRRGGKGRQSAFVKGGAKTKPRDKVKDVKAIVGDNKIVETLDGLQFELSSASFFQTNTNQASRLVQLVREACGFSGDRSEIVLDLFCGTGAMGLSVASSARQVMGWEIVPEAVRDAKRNAEMNGIANAKFYRVDLARLNASKGAQGLLTTPKGKELPMPDVVITDPARPGMDAKLISILRTIGARRIVYVSCNPATQARDAALLTAESQGAHDVQYALTKCTPVDMFPHTAHVESVAVFDRVGSA